METKSRLVCVLKYSKFQKICYATTVTTNITQMMIYCGIFLEPVSPDVVVSKVVVVSAVLFGSENNVIYFQKNFL